MTTSEKEKKEAAVSKRNPLCIKTCRVTKTVEKKNPTRARLDATASCWD